MPLKNGEESRFEESLDADRIKKQPVEQIKEILRLIMLKVGLRAANLPNEEEKAVLIAHIVTEYGNHTLEEIKLAFDMAISGKLDLEQKDITCYENFSCLYFSTIMTAYRNWAKETYKFIKIVPKMIEEKKSIEHEEMLEWINEWSAKENIDIELIPLQFYDFLVGANLINVSNKEKHGYLAKATSQIKVRLIDAMSLSKNDDAYKAFKLFEKMEVEGFEGEMKSRIINRSKRLILNEYLLSLKPTSINFK